jgi:hypothetical protein
MKHAKEKLIELLDYVQSEGDYVRLSRLVIREKLEDILCHYPEEVPTPPPVPEPTTSTPIWQVLMRRDGTTEEQAINDCKNCRIDLMSKLDRGEDGFDILSEWFGLEPDWNDDLVTNKYYM